MQVNCDWHMMGTPEHLERELAGFVFDGPGFYLTVKDTLLVLPVDDTLFRAYVYNCPFADTVFSGIAAIPVRSDKR